MRGLHRLSGNEAKSQYHKTLPIKKIFMPNKTNNNDLQQAASQRGLKVESAMLLDLEEALTGCDPLLGEVLEYALFAGGKRIRPLLAVLSAAICGRRDDGTYLLAAALEYLHVATLIHDDVIDHADERRGRPAVVKKYGTAAAILAGDWLHARAMHLVGRLTGAEGLTVFCRATGAMVDGEFLQIRYAGNPDIGEEEYFAVIARKTASLISSTCVLGGLYGGGTQEELAALGDYGEKVGTAFQVVDDLLDYLGDSEKTGKQVGNDFVEGKMTLPLIIAMERGSDEERQEISVLMKGERKEKGAREKLCRIVTGLDGFSLARKRAEVLVKEAENALRVFKNNGNSKTLELMVAVGNYILIRSK